jgi:hypothetical protein
MSLLILTSSVAFLAVMYAIAVVEIQLEAVSIATLLFFVMPLSFTLTTFLLWIMYGLQGEAILSMRLIHTNRYTDTNSRP